MKTTVDLSALPAIDHPGCIAILKSKWYPELVNNLRVGGQASVIAYSDKAWLTAILGKLYIRVMSIFAYAY